MGRLVSMRIFTGRLIDIFGSDSLCILLSVNWPFLAAIFPVAWISTTTHDRRNHYFIWIDSIQDGIGKLEGQITTNLTFNNRPALWCSNNSKYGVFYSVDEILLSILLSKELYSLRIFLQGCWVKFIFHFSESCRICAKAISPGIVWTAPLSSSAVRS